MRRLFLPPGAFQDVEIRITGQDLTHLARVLRMRPGERLELLNGEGEAFLAELVTVERDVATARTVSPLTDVPEPWPAITVLQAVGKGDRFDEVLQHATEAGAAEFIPLLTERCVVELKADRVEARLERWRSIAKGAAEQSGRCRVPTVRAPLAFRDWVAAAGSAARWLLHAGEPSVPLANALGGSGIPAVVQFAVGPEGGFSPAEVSAAVAGNVTPIMLGPRILRTETAAIVAISQILFAAGEPRSISVSAQNLNEGE